MQKDLKIKKLPKTKLNPLVAASSGTINQYTVGYELLNEIHQLYILCMFAKMC